MPDIGLHIMPSGNRWSVRRGGSARAWKLFPTKKEAIAAAMSVFPKRKAILYVHDDTGRIMNRCCRPIITRK